MNKKDDFMTLAEEMYDKSLETIATEDEDKIIGRLVNLARAAKKDDGVDALLHLAIFTKVMHGYDNE